MSDPDTAGFYDELAPFYPSLYSSWDDAIARQGAALSKLLLELGLARDDTVLDAACGVGTQALGLLSQGHRVVASDLWLEPSRDSKRNLTAAGYGRKHASMTCANSPGPNRHRSPR